MKKIQRGKDILLFYEKHKWDFVENYSKRTISGFYAWYKMLVESLRAQGYTVHENDYDLALNNPEYPVGLVGTPDCVDNWKLPNPAILGPSMYDNPRIKPDLMKDIRFKKYLLTCEWLKDIFYPYYGDSCELWFAGVDTEAWRDMSGDEKTVDILIYNKIRWGKEIMSPMILEKIISTLKNKGLSFEILQYGDITHEAYKSALSRSKSMLFLCEHETQGIAYMEALATNTPILAWDPGYWTDPVWSYYCEDVPKATSVPYFSPECGKRFKMMEDLDTVITEFMSKLASFTPRNFIEENCSQKKSAEVYTNYYFKL